MGNNKGLQPNNQNNQTKAYYQVNKQLSVSGYIDRVVQQMNDGYHLNKWMIFDATSDMHIHNAHANILVTVPVLGE